MSDYLKPVAAVLLPQVGAFFANYRRQNAASSGGTTWFQELKKPWFQPPRKLIFPAWTCLFTGMGYASYMVYRDGGGFNEETALPLACYGAQLALNWSYSPILFKYHKLGLASVVTVTLWGAILATIVTFNKVSPTASYLMMPYLGWVTLASCVTISIWRNNKDRTD